MALRNGRADGVKKKKNKTRIRNIGILVALIAVAVLAYSMAASDEYADTREAVLAKYLSYEDAEAVTYEDYIAGHGNAYVADTAKNITLRASDYSAADMAGLKEENGVVWTQESGSITWTADVQQAGLYYIRLTYYPETDSTQTILRNVYINGSMPFDDC